MTPSFQTQTSPKTQTTRHHRPTVTVCIVNWNCRELLRACLHSLQPRLQKVRLEIVVVDNASTDGAADMVAQEFPRVRLLRNNTNRGFAAANNQAARIAHGRYLFFLNNDTLVPPGALHGLIDFARSHPEAGLIGPGLRDPQGQPQVSCRLRPSVGALLHRTCLLRWTGFFRGLYRRYRFRQGDFQATRPVEVLMGAALLVRRRLFLRCGLWDEGYVFGGEDIDLCTRLGRTHAILYHPAVTIIHHGRMSSRQQIGYVHTNWQIGMARFLRHNGTSPLLLLLYKLTLTLDSPIQWLWQIGQYLWRRLRGQRAAATRSLLVARGVAHFLSRGLAAFWKA